MNSEGGTVVAKGNHVVPEGVAVEELAKYDRDGKLAKECPEAVESLMNKNGCMDVYEKMVTAIVNEKNTRSTIGKWKSEEVVSIIDMFRDDFADHGIKVALCKRTSGAGSYRWLEFIDVRAMKDDDKKYVPQYDVANYSGQVLKTMYTTLKFPNGVAVEEFKRYKSRKTLGESIPIYVEKMMKEKDLMAEYTALVDHIIEAGSGDKKWSEWDIQSLKDIAAAHTTIFETKGNVSVFVANKVEYVSHGQYGGHNEYFRWLEFVDRDQQPNYHPQRDANTSSEKCIIS